MRQDLGQDGRGRTHHHHHRVRDDNDARCYTVPFQVTDWPVFSCPYQTSCTIGPTTADGMRIRRPPLGPSGSEFSTSHPHTRSPHRGVRKKPDDTDHSRRSAYPEPAQKSPPPAFAGVGCLVKNAVVRLPVAPHLVGGIAPCPSDCAAIDDVVGLAGQGPVAD